MGYLGCPMGFGVAQSMKDEWLVEQVSGKLGQWTGIFLSMAGQVIVVNHIIGGLMNFYLGTWSLSKVAIVRVNRLLRDFVWGKEGGKGIRVGWKWCALPKGCGGLGVPNIIAKAKALAAKWVLKAIDSPEPWAELLKAHIQRPEFKDTKDWVGVSLEDKVFGVGELEVRGTSWVKRMWYAWVSARPLLDFRGLGLVGGSIVSKGCLWLEFLGTDEGGSVAKEMRLIRKIRRKGLWKWDQLWEEEGDNLKDWMVLKESLI